jgi:hypothetical protein
MNYRESGPFFASPRNAPGRPPSRRGLGRSLTTELAVPITRRASIAPRFLIDIWRLETAATPWKQTTAVPSNRQ